MDADHRRRRLIRQWHASRGSSRVRGGGPAEPAGVIAAREARRIMVDTFGSVGRSYEAFLDLLRSGTFVCAGHPDLPAAAIADNPELWDAAVLVVLTEVGSFRKTGDRFEMLDREGRRVFYCPIPPEGDPEERQ